MKIIHTIYLIIITIMIPSFTCCTYDVKNDHHSNTWKKVTLVYEKSFSLSAKNRSKIPAECTKTNNFPLKYITLICREEIQILCPSALLQHWQRSEKKEGFLPLGVKSKNKTYAHVHIIAVKPFAGIVHKNTVVGVIKHYARVKSYYFKNIRTSEINMITATPEHPFYISNLHQFIAISHVTTSDFLINSHGDKLRIMCRDNKRRYCGVEKTSSEIVPVYNLKIAQKHYYFAGENAVLVHNCTGMLEKMQYDGTNESGKVYEKKMEMEEIQNQADKHWGRVYKLGKDVYKVGGQTFAENEFMAERINYVYKHIYDGKFQKYAVAEVCEIGNHPTLKTPYIEGTVWAAKKLKLTVNKATEALTNYQSEMLRLGVWIDDYKDRANLIYIDDYLIPIDFDLVCDINTKAPRFRKNTQKYIDRLIKEGKDNFEEFFY